MNVFVQVTSLVLLATVAGAGCSKAKEQKDTPPAPAAAKPGEPDTTSPPQPVAATPAAPAAAASKANTPENLAACKKVMAAARACRKDKAFVAAIRKGFKWDGGWDHAFDTSDGACDAFLDPDSYLDADDNPRVDGADLTDKKVLDGLVAVAGKDDCAALAREFNKGDPDSGRVGYPYIGPEAL